MNIKKILSMLVVLAMIMAVVPSLGLVASAADASEITMEVLQKYAENVFTHSNFNGGDVIITGNNNGDYTGWSSSFAGTNFTTGSDPANINGYWNSYQVYGAQGSKDTLKMGNGYGDGKNFVILEFRQDRTTGSGNDYRHEFAVKDLNDNVIETGYIARTSQEGFPDGFRSGKTSSFADVAPTPVNATTKAAMNNESIKLSTGYNTGTRMVFVNNGNNTYSVIYYLADNAKETDENTYFSNRESWASSKWTKLYTATYEGQFNGIGSIEYAIAYTTGWGHNHRVHHLRIFAGDLPKTTVTVNLVDGKEILETKTYDDQIIGESFTPNAYEYYVNSAKDILYKRADAVSAVTVEEKMVINVPYSKFRSIVGGNVIENSSFEADTSGWTTGKGNDLLSNATTFSLVEDADLATDGTHVLKAENSINNGGGTEGDHSIVTKWDVDTDSEYFLSVDAMQVRKSNNPYTWFATYTSDTENRITSNLGNTERIQFSSASLEPYQLIVNTGDATQVGYTASWFQDATVYYDNFQLYKLAPLATQKSATVTQTAGGKIVATKTEFISEGESISLPAATFYYDGKIYSVEEVTVSYTDDVLEKTADAVVEHDYAATKVAHDAASPGGRTTVGPYVAAAGKDSITDDDGTNLSKDTNAFGNNRYVDFTFNTPKLEEGKVAVLHLAAGGADDNWINVADYGQLRLKGEYGKLYFFTTTPFVDSSNGPTWDSNAKKDQPGARVTVFNTPQYTTADITDIVKAANENSEDTFSIKIKASAGAVGFVDNAQSALGGIAQGYASYIELVDGVNVTVEGATDSALITKNGSAVKAPFLAANGDTVRVYNGTDNASGLATTVVNGEANYGETITINGATTIKVVERPKAPKAELGFADGEFFINFTADNAFSITPEDAAAQEFKAGTVVTVATKATNRIYTAVATVANGVVKSTENPVSIYSLVVDALASKTGVAKDKQDAVNSVIAAGGIYLSADGKLTDEAKAIMAYEDGVVSIDSTIYGYGVGFTVVKDTLYVGNAPENAADVKTTDEGTAKVYQYLKIDGENVLLSNDSTFAQDVALFSLESVNIEFIETLIEESEAADADVDFDFIPEL